MDDSYRNNDQGDNPGVTGFSGQDAGSDSNARNFQSTGAGGGSTGFSNSGTGQGTTGFGTGEAEVSGDSGDNVTGNSSNHSAAFDAPGAGSQSTGASYPNQGGSTGFEGGGSGGGGSDNSSSDYNEGQQRSGAKGAMDKVKDAFTN